MNILKCYFITKNHSTKVTILLFFMFIFVVVHYSTRSYSWSWCKNASLWSLQNFKITLKLPIFCFFLQCFWVWGAPFSTLSNDYSCSNAKFHSIHKKVFRFPLFKLFNSSSMWSCYRLHACYCYAWLFLCLILFDMVVFVVDLLLVIVDSLHGHLDAS